MPKKLDLLSDCINRLQLTASSSQMKVILLCNLRRQVQMSSVEREAEPARLFARNGQAPLYSEAVIMQATPAMNQ